MSVLYSLGQLCIAWVSSVHPGSVLYSLGQFCWAWVSSVLPEWVLCSLGQVCAARVGWYVRFEQTGFGDMSVLKTLVLVICQVIIHVRTAWVISVQSVCVISVQLGSFLYSLGQFCTAWVSSAQPGSVPYSLDLLSAARVRSSKPGFGDMSGLNRLDRWYVSSEQP